jgi:hypothetical protein
LFGFVGRLTVTGYVSDGTLNNATRQIVAKPIIAGLPGSVARCFVVKLRTHRNRPICAVINDSTTRNWVVRLHSQDQFQSSLVCIVVALLARQQKWGVVHRSRLVGPKWPGSLE